LTIGKGGYRMFDDIVEWGMARGAFFEMARIEFKLEKLFVLMGLLA